MAADGSTLPEIIARCHRNFVEGTWSLVELGPKAHRKDWTGATAIGNAIPSSLTNTLFVTGAEVDLPPLLAEARRFYGPNTPWRVVGTSVNGAAVRAGARGLGARDGETVPGMLLDPLPVAPAFPRELTAREVSSSEDLREFRRAGGAGFRIPAWALRVSIPQIPRGDPEKGGYSRFFVGSVAGRPVATSALFQSDDIAGVYFVATVPDARRKGYGAALTWMALEVGRRAGARVGYLQATEMGRPVYERMGFRRVVDYPEWHSEISGIRTAGAILRMLWLGVSHLS